MHLKPYSIFFSEGRKAEVINKMAGRKRSLRIFFLKLRRSKTLIKYTVLLKEEPSAKYSVYKEKKTGDWIKGGEKDGVKISGAEQPVVEALEHAIDHFEASLGKEAYKELF